MNTEVRMPTAERARRRDAAAAVAPKRETRRDALRAHLRTRRRRLTLRYGVDAWDALMYAVAYGLVILLYASDLSA